MGGWAGLTIVQGKWSSDASLSDSICAEFLFFFSELSKKLLRDSTKRFEWVIESPRKHLLL